MIEQTTNNNLKKDLYKTLVQTENLKSNMTLKNSHFIPENLNKYRVKDKSTLAIEKEEIHLVNSINNFDCINNNDDDDNDKTPRKNNVDTELTKFEISNTLQLNISRFPYLENTKNETILPTSIVTNIEDESLLQENTALTLVDAQNNLILAYKDEFFFLKQ